MSSTDHATKTDNAAPAIAALKDTPRVGDLRRRVRAAMYADPVFWECPESIDPTYANEPLAVRKARALARKVSSMPTDLWTDQLFAGSLTLETPRIHAEKGFPQYLNAGELRNAEELGLGTGCFGHIVPDYPLLLSHGISGIKERISAARIDNTTEENEAFFDSVEVALDGVLAYAAALASRCDADAANAAPKRASELRRMAANLRIAPGGPAESFWQALQSVWLLHMIFHATKNNNALGRIDQYAWPFLERDLESGVLTLEEAAELVDCFTLKFNERAQTNEEQEAENRLDEAIDTAIRTRHGTSSQLGRTRDQLDATNHWLQNIIIGGILPDGSDGTNPLSFLVLRSFRNNEMTNPLVTVRIHGETPEELITYACETLKDGGGMPAFFNDDQLIPALVALGIDMCDARDYTNDGCWEIIIPGRTDFKFQRLSLMLCLEWALNRGITRLTGIREGIDTGDPAGFLNFGDVWDAFAAQLEHMIGETTRQVWTKIDERSVYAPVPLLSAFIEGAIPTGTDMTAGGAKYRTHGMLAESVAHTIDSLTAIQKVVFESQDVSIGELCAALATDFDGNERLRRLLHDAPKYGNDDPYADDMGTRVIDAFTSMVATAAAAYSATVRFPCGVATFSWYIGIGEGLGASPDGRKAGEPVSSNFSPALGRDLEGVPAAVLS